MPATKYYEGRAAALAEVRRAIRRLPDQPNDDGADSRRALDLIRARWASDCNAPGRTGPAWAGYLAGGIDALDELVASQEPRVAP